MCNEYIPVMESRTTCWLVSKHKQVGALSGISISLKMISPVFPGANGEMFSALEEVNLLPQHPLSARERRRLKQRALESAVHVRTDRCNVSQFLCFHSDSMSWLLREYTCSYLPFKKDAVYSRICAFLGSLQEEVPAGQTPLLQPDSFSLHSNLSLDVEQVKGKNEERLHRLTELQQKSPSLGMLPVAHMMQ